MADMTLKEMLNKLIEATNSKALSDDIPEIVQTTGTAMDKVMSQAVVTEITRPITDEEIDEICDDDEGEPVPLEAVLYVQQTLTEEQKAQARNNMEIKDLNKYLAQEAGNSSALVMSQAATTKLVEDALGTGGSAEYETVDSIEEMVDTSKQYVLSKDGYIYAYTTTTETVEHPAENKFVASEATLNQRMGSSSLTSQNGYVWSNPIAVDMSKESPYRVKVEGTMIAQDTSANQKLWLCSDETGNTKLNAMVILLGDTSSNYTTLLDDGTIYADYKGGAKLADSYITGTKSIRVGFKFSDSTIASESELSGVSITIPSEAYTEEVEVSAWTNTGLKPDAAGGGNYVTLKVEVDQNKIDIKNVDKRVTALETGADTLTIPDWWMDAVDACIAKIKALQVGRQCITFPFFSDNHQRNGYAGVLIAKVMQECNIPYCINGGDSIDSGYIADEATMIAQDAAFDQMMSYVPNGRLCRAVGNHDGYWAVSDAEKHHYTRDQVYELFLREESVAQNKHYGGDGTYYYIDELASKVRFVVLNTNAIRDASGTIIGDTVEAEQLAWLTDTAFKLPDSDWAVVMISHQPISNHYHANISNAAAVIAAVTSAGVEIIGWFSGHIHRDRIYTGIATDTTTDAQGAALGFTQVTITSDHTGIAYDDATKHTVANDDQSHAIDFVTINRSTRKVNLTRLGIGEDRQYSY